MTGRSVRLRIREKRREGETQEDFITLELLVPTSGKAVAGGETLASSLTGFSSAGCIRLDIGLNLVRMAGIVAGEFVSSHTPPNSCDFFPLLHRLPTPQPELVA